MKIPKIEREAARRRAVQDTVTAKCIGCEATREIKAGEVPPGEQPMCEKCGMPMVAVQANGFTVLEVLVVLAVILLVCGMFAPVVRNMRLQHDKRVNPLPPGAATNMLSPRTEYRAPTFDITKHKPSGPDIDPAAINPENNGYLIDMDSDGVADKVMLDDTGKVTWSKGRTSGGFYYPVVVLEIKGQSLMAYTISTRPGDTRPSILFWTSGDRRGYHVTCAGITESGYPYFGTIEAGE